MLSLFTSLFGSEPIERGRYPENAVQEGLCLALDATDPRIRTLPGYDARLRPAVLHAFDHLVALVDRLPSAIDLTWANYSAEPRLLAFFASADHMQHVIREDEALSEFRAGTEGQQIDEIYSLLMMRRSERHVLGLEPQSEMVHREVAQVAVDFAGHHFLESAGSATELKQRLYRRAYNHILELTLERIVSTRTQSNDFKRQRDLLRRKLGTLGAGCWGLSGERGAPMELKEVEGRRRREERGLSSQRLSVHPSPNRHNVIHPSPNREARELSFEKMKRDQKPRAVNSNDEEQKKETYLNLHSSTHTDTYIVS